MENLIGITGKDFTIIAASKAAMRGASILKANEDKTRRLSPHTVLAFSGEAGDTVQFAEFIQANVALYSMRNNHTLQPPAIASFIRSELATSLRSRHPYTVNLLLGGVTTPSPENPSEQLKPKLYWIDYLASCAEVPYAAHGYAQYYCLSILDKHHSPDMDFQQGMKCLKLCADELRRRLPIDFKGFAVKVITKDGVRIEDFAEDFGVKSA